MTIDYSRNSRNRRVRQFYYNLDDIIGGYENGQLDDPEHFPNLTEDEWFDMVMADMYHMKADGWGSVYYGKDICGDLRFLGNDNMRRMILQEVHNEGMVSE